MIIHQKPSQKGEVGWGSLGFTVMIPRFGGFVGGATVAKPPHLIFENISGKIGFDPFGYFWGDAGDGNQLLKRGFLDIFD